MSILIKGGRVIDPASGLDAIADVAVADGRVVGIQTIPADFRPSHILEAGACVVAPGLIDLAARLREPGHEHAGGIGTKRRWQNCRSDWHGRATDAPARLRLARYSNT